MAFTIRRAAVIGPLLVILAGCESPSIDRVLGSEKLAVPSETNRVAARSRQPAAAINRATDAPTLRTRTDLGTGEFVSRRRLPERLMEVTGQDRVTLNLVNVTVAQAAKSILGDLLRVNYVVDDRVKGTVSVQTSQPVDAMAMMAMFESALRTSGAVIVQDRDFYRITPVESAASLGSPLQSVEQQSDRAIQLGQRSQVVTLKFVSAREMERILRPISRRESIVHVDQTRNLLILSGNDNDVRTLREAVQVFDVDWMKGMSFALVPLTSSDPETIVAELDTVFFNDRDGPAKGVVRFVPNRRLNAVLIISSQPKYIAPGERWVRRLDAAAKNGEEQLYVYHIQNRPAAELAQVLRKVLVADIDTVAAPAPQAAVAPRFNAVAASLPQVVAIQPTLAQRLADGQQGRSQEQPAAAEPEPSEMTRTAAAARPSRMRIVADEANNAILINATPADYKRALRVLERIDAVANQVLIEATIAEVSLNDELKFGVKWFFQKGNSALSFTDAASGAVASQFPGFSYFFSVANAKAAIDALASITKVKVISSPSVMVLDNKTAVLQVGDQVPVITQSAVSVATTGSPIVNTVQFKDTGVILSVTPRVSDSGRVTLLIEQEVSDVTKTTSSGIDSPTIQQRRIKTTVAVNDGASLTLGGLMQERNKLNKSQLPLAGDIPLLDNLFKQKEDTIDRTELVIIITPRVVRDQNEAALVTDEFRRRLSVPLSPAGPPDRRENVRRLLQ
ncbi:type II secretion system secretin GspD [Hyphomicrobium sp.]|uniref:type II secretion system secretin GspD n=1 Tax=Hyphomicrobium sp. TaxID=82 RepID=UPI00132933A6|nr:type II secretion system secretin GspD [Hyphomicrobium sp.]KAB2936992.1 MAG: type II secretion system protein GspD [Hyphomicrobium sp.]